MRILAVCHDSVGIGHLRRTLAIAEQAAAGLRDCRVLVASGSLHAGQFALPERVDYIKLPALCKRADRRYAAKSLDVSFADVISIRSSLLTAAAASYRPDVLLIDKSPTGVAGEAETALRLVRDRHVATRVIFGMRDIEDDPERTRAEWQRSRHVESLARLCDEIWVYGDASVFDVAEAYELPDEITEKLRYVGYIARRPCDHGVLPRAAGAARRVLVTVGGGTDGHRLIDLYLRDAPHEVGGAPVHTTVIGGPDLPRDSAEQFRRQAAGLPQVTFDDCRSCMFCEYRQADLVLCMGGYNTMIEVLSAERPMLVFPRTEPRREQYMRAERFAALGLCDYLEPDTATPATIRAAVERLLCCARPAGRSAINVDGLSCVVERLSELEGTCRDAMAVCV
ncbi:MAG: glycosyltransferase [Phycisphaerae bacterium]